MAIVQKTLRFEYQSKNKTTGLTDVVAQIYLNGVAKAVGSSAISFTPTANGSKIVEVDSSNSPGLYEVVLTAADLTAYGVVTGQANTVVAYINSPSSPASAPIRKEQTLANEDDIVALIGTPATTSVSGDIAAVKTVIGNPANGTVSADIAAVEANIVAVRADLETASSSLPNILAAIQSLQNAAIGNGVGFVLPTLTSFSTGTTPYLIPITIQNSEGQLVDATSGVTIGVKNASGTDRGSYLTGSSGSPATTSATHVSTGQYTAQVNIPASAPEEELIFSFSYTVNGNTVVRFGVAQVILDIATDGYALQSTLLATQTTVNTINSIVGNATYGNAAIQALLTNGTYGLSAIQALITNGTYGLSAIQSAISAVQSSVNSTNASLANSTYGLSALQAQNAATQGTGFTAGTDDLHSLSTFVRANIYSGGRAV